MRATLLGLGLSCVVLSCSPAPEPELPRLSFPAVVGPKGAVVSGAPGTELDGVELVIPPGALSSDLELTARLLAEEPVLGPTGYVVGPTFLFEPDGQALARPATVKLPLSPSRVADLEQAPADCRAWLRTGEAWAQVPQTGHGEDFVQVELSALGGAAAGAVLKSPTTAISAGPRCTDPSGFCVTALPTLLDKTSTQYSTISGGKLHAWRSRSTATGLAGVVTEYDVATGTITRVSPELEYPASASLPRPFLSDAQQRVALAPDGTVWVALPDGLAQISFTAKGRLLPETDPDTRTAAIVFTADGVRHRVRLVASKAGTVTPALTLSSSTSAVEPSPTTFDKGDGAWRSDQLPVVPSATTLGYAFPLAGNRLGVLTPPRSVFDFPVPAALTAAERAVNPTDELAFTSDGQVMAVSLVKPDAQGRSLWIQSRDGSISRGIAGLGNLAALEFGADGTLWAAPAGAALVFRIEPTTGAVSKVELTEAAFGTEAYKARLPLALRAFTFPASGGSPARDVLFVITAGTSRTVVRVERSSGTVMGDGGVDAGVDAGLDAGTDAGTDAGSDAGLDGGGPANDGGFCGDGILQSPEACDGLQSTASCGDQQFVRGTPSCLACSVSGFSDCFQRRARAAAVTSGLVCAIAESDGVARCAGLRAPVAELDGGSMAAVAVGPSSSGKGFVCGLRTIDGTVACAGTQSAAQPTTSAAYAELAATESTTCAVRSGGGSVDCWGTALNGAFPTGSHGISASRTRLCALNQAGDATCLHSSNAPETFTGPFSQVATGESFAAALLPDGGLATLGTLFGVPMPTRGPYVRVVAADGHACAERAAKGVDCWGATPDSRALVPSATGTLAAAGGGSACQLDRGELLCFGSDFPFDARPFASPFDRSRAPASLEGPAAVLVGGDYDVCARPPGASSLPFCRGSMFGLEGFAAGRAFTRVFTGPTAGFGRAWCGLDAQRMLHCTTMGEVQPPRGPYRFVDEELAFAITDAGAIEFFRTPAAAIATPPAVPLRAAAVGALHGCGLRAADGNAVCWGNGFAGEDVAPSGSFTQVTVTVGRSCALTASGSITCWGQNATSIPAGTFRELGFTSGGLCGLTLQGARVCRAVGGSDVTEAGPFRVVRSECRISGAGDLSCADAGTRDPRSPVSFTETPSGEFLDVASSSPTGLALRADGGVRFWGPGASPTVPVKSGALTTTFGCFVMADDTMRCFGNQLTQTVAPPSAGTFSQVALAVDVGCAVRMSDRRVTCFGNGSRAVVSAAPTTDAFLRIAVTMSHACGVRTDNTLRCWGDNSLGLASPPVGSFVDVAVSAFRSCALDAQGAITCWGLGATSAALPSGERYRALRSASLGPGLCGLFTDGGAVCQPLDGAQLSGPVVDVVTGLNTSCALRPDGGVDCVRGRNDLFGL